MAKAKTKKKKVSKKKKAASPISTSYKRRSVDIEKITNGFLTSSWDEKV